MLTGRSGGAGVALGEGWGDLCGKGETALTLVGVGFWAVGPPDWHAARMATKLQATSPRFTLIRTGDARPGYDSS